MTLARAAVGTEFRIGDGGTPTEVFTKVAEVLSLSGPEITAEEIDVTSLDSTGGYKEVITGLKDGGTVALEMNWIRTNAQQGILRGMVDSGLQRNGRIVFSDTTQAAFGFKVTSFSMGAEPGAQLKASVNIKISGAVTWT
jgi:predicted secreted protein